MYCLMILRFANEDNGQRKTMIGWKDWSVFIRNSRVYCLEYIYGLHHIQYGLVSLPTCIACDSSNCHVKVVATTMSPYLHRI